MGAAPCWETSVPLQAFVGRSCSPGDSQCDQEPQTGNQFPLGNGSAATASLHAQSCTISRTASAPSESRLLHNTSRLIAIAVVTGLA